MKLEGKQRKIDGKVVRLGDDLDYVDVVSTSEGMVRVGIMPEVSKLIAQQGITEKYVVVPDVKLTQLGENRCSEEFVMWNAIFLDKTPRHYVGTEGNVTALRNVLEIVNPWYFNDDRTEIAKMDWLDDYFVGKPTSEGVFTDCNVKVDMTGGNIRIFDKEGLVYDYNSLKPKVDIDAEVDRLVGTVAHDIKPREHLEVVAVGSGNGFAGKASSFIVMYGDRKIWIDASARPHETLGDIGINWDDITDYLVTHNHSDHFLGFPASLQRQIKKGKRISLITSRAVYDTLKEQVPADLDAHVELVEVDPEGILDYHGARFDFRSNHHLLKPGTLGFKVAYGGRTFGFSGDTKFSEEVNKHLGRPELDADWFRGCNLTFHEVDFRNPQSVHTFHKDLRPIEDLVRSEGGVFLAYHALPDGAPMPTVEDGKTYRV